MSNITISGTARPPNVVNVIASAGTIVFDLTKGQAQQNTLTANVTASSLVAGPIGFYALIFIQNSTGGFTVVFPTTFKGVQQPDPGVSVRSTQIVFFDGTNVIAFGDQVTT